ncbi:MAG: riboflavin kinase [Anaerovoracaceae bacterium]
MVVEFLKRLRSEKKFSSLDELKAQMKIDKSEAEDFHRKAAAENESENA